MLFSKKTLIAITISTLKFSMIIMLFGINKIIKQSNSNFSPKVFIGNGFLPEEYIPEGNPATTCRRRKKNRRMKCSKNKEEREKRRMTHIDVERNRRRQMNNYLAVLRSLRPPSYAQWGDQGSIVGGAINFVKELEQLLQFLQAHTNSCHPLFSSFFTFPQYSTSHGHPMAVPDGAADNRMAVADIEVTMTESHANIKVLTRKQPKQLLKIVTWLHSMFLIVLHLNVTTIGHMVLYTFSVKVEDNCQLNTAGDIATAVHEMLAMNQVLVS